ncbi:MAG: glycosyltransferase [Acidobacteria bacterium]|nr:glycosyltransferase [Acidobacteriota bacterium]
MRIVYLTAGAGGTICGNCLRDNTLATALRRLGEDVILLPVYTPIRTDELDVSEREVYLGGVNIYLQQKSALFRALPRFLDRALDNPSLLRWVSKFAVKTLPEDLGALTVATVLGEQGPLRKEVRRLTDHLKELRPDVVHLTNSMLAGLAPAIRRELSVPVVCALQGEDYYLEHLPEPYSSEAFEILRGMAPSVDRFVAPCRDHARALAKHLRFDPEAAAVVLPGISLEDFPAREPRRKEPFTVGYLARIAPEKGLDLLVKALPPDAHLRAAGWVSPEHEPFVESVLQAVDPARFSHFRDVDRREKIDHLGAADVLSVPTLYGASKGLYVLEAWAAGIPAVQPRIGVFPELFEAAGGGGLLFEPGDAEGLRTALERLRDKPEEAAAMGRHGRDAVERFFNAERMAQETVAVYQDLLGRGVS